MKNTTFLKKFFSVVIPALIIVIIIDIIPIFLQSKNYIFSRLDKPITGKKISEIIVYSVFLDNKTLIKRELKFPFKTIAMLNLKAKPLSHSYFTWQMKYGENVSQTCFLYIYNLDGKNWMDLLVIDEEKWHSKLKWSIPVDDNSIIYTENAKEFKLHREICTQSQDKRTIHFYNYEGEMISKKTFSKKMIFYSPFNAFDGRFFFELIRWRRIDIGFECDPEEVVYDSRDSIYIDGFIYSFDFELKQVNKEKSLPNIIEIHRYPTYLTATDGLWFHNEKINMTTKESDNSYRFVASIYNTESILLSIDLFGYQDEKAFHPAIFNATGWDFFGMGESDDFYHLEKIFLKPAEGTMICCVIGGRILGILTDKGYYEYNISRFR